MQCFSSSSIDVHSIRLRAFNECDASKYVIHSRVISNGFIQKVRFRLHFSDDDIRCGSGGGAVVAAACIRYLCFAF